MSAAAAQSCAAPPLGPPAPAEALVRTLWSALSRGTERLVFEGRVAAVESERMRAPMQEGDFPFPVKYGYCAVGTRRGRVRATSSAGRCSRCIRIRTASSAPAAMPRPRAAGRAGAPRRARRQHGNGAERALGFRRRAGRPDRRRRRRRGRAASSRYLAARLPGAEVTLVDVDLSRADSRRGVSAAPSRSRSTRRATRTSSSTPARPRPDLPAPWPAPASRRRSSR